MLLNIVAVLVALLVTAHLYSTYQAWKHQDIAHTRALFGRASANTELALIVHLGLVLLFLWLGWYSFMAVVAYNWFSYITSVNYADRIRATRPKQAEAAQLV